MVSADVAIVSIECLSPLGMDLRSTWRRLCAGESGIRRITRFDSSIGDLRGLSSVQYAGEIPVPYEELAGSQNQWRKSPEPIGHCIAQVCKQAMQQVGFCVQEHDAQRIALVGATALTSHVSHWQLARTGRPFATISSTNVKMFRWG